HLGASARRRADAGGRGDRDYAARRWQRAQGERPGDARVAGTGPCRSGFSRNAKIDTGMKLPIEAEAAPTDKKGAPQGAFFVVTTGPRGSRPARSAAATRAPAAALPTGARASCTGPATGLASTRSTRTGTTARLAGRPRAARLVAVRVETTRVGVVGREHRCVARMAIGLGAALGLS